MLTLDIRKATVRDWPNFYRHYLAPNGSARPGASVINQRPGVIRTGAGADFALMRDGKKRLALLDTDTNLSSQGGGSLRFVVS